MAIATAYLKGTERYPFFNNARSSSSLVGPSPFGILNSSRKCRITTRITVFDVMYIPSMHRRDPSLSYRFANVVRLGEGTDYIRFLRAVVEGAVFYDPGIKLEHISGRPVTKRRSQFRIASGDIPRLYARMDTQSVSP